MLAGEIVGVFFTDDPHGGHELPLRGLPFPHGKLGKHRVVKALKGLGAFGYAVPGVGDAAPEACAFFSQRFADIARIAALRAFVHRLQIVFGEAVFLKQCADFSVIFQHHAFQIAVWHLLEGAFNAAQDHFMAQGDLLCDPRIPGAHLVFAAALLARVFFALKPVMFHDLPANFSVH